MKSQIMKCGNCGKRRVTLRAVSDGRSQGPFVELRAKCCSCKSVTVFALRPPAFSVEWGEGAKGILCVGWS